MNENYNKLNLQIGTPDNVEKIQWSKNFRLKIEHLQKEQASENGKFAVSILPEYTIGLIGKQLTNYEISNLKVKSLFRPLDAKLDRKIWPENKKEQALMFYQGAFDLAEEIARKSQTELEKKLFRQIFPCKGRGKSERRKFAQENAQKQITILMTPFLKEYFNELNQYEKSAGTPEKFEKNYSEYQIRFDELRKDVSA